MINVISKFLPIPFYPLGFSLVLSAVALGLLLWNKRKAGIVLLCISFGELLVFSLPVTEHCMLRSLESKFAPPEIFPHCSAVVLLGGSEVPPLPPRQYPETNEWGDRIMHAARIYKMGHAPWLIVSGGKLTFMHDFPGCEADISASLLNELFGIDSAVILKERDAKNTHDHAPNIRKILEAKNLPSDVIVVTSVMHMYRSVKILRKAGFTVHPAPTDYRADTRFQWKLINFLPRAGSLASVTAVLHEYYGLISYRIFGWI